MPGPIDQNPWVHSRNPPRRRNHIPIIGERIHLAMITVVVVVLLMRGRFGLGCRRRRRLRSLIALRRRRIKYHAVELYRLLGVSLEWRDDHTKGKGQDRKTHHRISSDFLPSDFRHSALA